MRRHTRFPKGALVPLLILLLAGCGTQLATLKDKQLRQIGFELPQPPEEETARLVLTAYPHVGFAPMRVTLTAALQNVSTTDQRFHCLGEEWAFGDGAVSGYRPNCEPFVETSTITTEFLAEHLFQSGGDYEIRVRLGDGMIVSNPVRGRVLSRN